MRFLLLLSSLGLLGAAAGCTTGSGYGGVYQPGYSYSGYGPANMWSETAAPNGFFYFGGGRLDSGWRGDRFRGGGSYFAEDLRRHRD